jgi:cell division protein FtsZ
VGGAPTFVLLVIGLLALLVVARLLTFVPGWVRRIRRPETRSIRVIGVGGAGSNAVDRMINEQVLDVDFVACNTDAQALRHSLARTRIRIGDSITGGLGSGGDPDVGRRSAEDGADIITAAVTGADLLFVTAGLGGGTGSGAAPLVAAKAKAQGALTIGVVTKPFAFEGTKRQRIAEDAAKELRAQVDALIIIPNDRLSEVVLEDASMLDAFGVVDGVLVQTVQGIIDLLTAPGLINVDFADIRAVMQDAGPALIGLGRGSGEHRASDAARQAISSPLLEATIDGARNLLFNVSGPADLQLREVRLAADEIRAAADPDANVIFGASFSQPSGEDVLVTLIATGLNGHTAAGPARPRPSIDDRVRPATESKRSSRRAAAIALETPPARIETSAATPESATSTAEPPATTAEPPAAAQEPPAAAAESAAPGEPPAAAAESAAPGEPTGSFDENDYEIPSFLRRRTPPGDR